MRFGLREMLLLFILLALPLSSYRLVFRPQNREIEQARREIDHKRLMLQKLETATAQNADLQRANTEITRAIETIESRLPTNKEMASVVQQVSDLALQAGLEPPAIESDKRLDAGMYKEQPLKVKISGDFNGFYDFLVRLERLPRITRIPDMRITRSSKQDGHMTAEFTLSIYFQEEESR